MALALQCLTVLVGCILGTPGQGGGFDYQGYLPGGKGGAQGQAGGFDYSKYMQGGGGGGGDYGNYQQYMQGGGAGFNYSQYMGGGGDYSQYMGGGGDYSKYMQGGGAGFNYSQYMGGGSQGGSYGDYQQYMQGGGAGFNYSQYMGGSSQGGSYGDYQQYMQGGGAGFNYSQYMGGGGDYSQYMGGGGDYSKYMKGGGAGFNYSQYVGGGSQGGSYGDYQQYMQGGGGYFNYSQYTQGYGGGGQDKGDQEGRLARAKADASHTLQQLRVLLDQVSNASADVEERDVRQHMLASLTDQERDASARWARMRQEFHDLHEQFQRDGANRSQDEKSAAALHAKHLDENLTLLEAQLENSTGRAERFVADFVRHRVRSDEDKAANLARLAGVQSSEMESLARSLGNREEQRSARDVNQTARGLAKDISDAAEALARSVEALARRSEASLHQRVREDQARRRAELKPAEDEHAPGAMILVATDTVTPRSSVVPRLLGTLLLPIPMVLGLLHLRRRGRATAVAAATEESELPYLSLA